MLQWLKTAGVGVVEYKISDEEKDVIDARYISSGSMAQSPGSICLGKAQGDTSNGFPGDYLIRYFDAEGRPVGDYDWHIEPIGEGYRLTWRNRAGNALPTPPGAIVFEGFGFPNAERSIAVAYWLSEELTAALEARASGKAQAS
jgi:hypothetical protein